MADQSKTAGQPVQSQQPAPPDVQQLQAEAQQCGLDPALFGQLAAATGGFVAQAVVELIKRRSHVEQRAAAAQPARSAQGDQGEPQQFGWPSFDLSMAFQLAATLLRQHRDQILAFTDQVEARALDMLISALENR